MSSATNLVGAVRVKSVLKNTISDPKSEVAAPAIENIADAVTHARFVGTDPGSDEVVLMKILHVSRPVCITPNKALYSRVHLMSTHSVYFHIVKLQIHVPSTPQPLYNTIVGVHSINDVS